MALFIVSTISILSILYLRRLVKYKFKNEKDGIIRNIHIAMYLITFIPFLSVVLMVFLDNVIMVVPVIIIYITIYLLYMLYINRKSKNG